MKFWIVLIAVAVFAFLSVAAIAAEKEKSVGNQYEKATFAGGCFWCMQPPFDKKEGVIETTVGYIGGHKKNPTYEEVSSGETGHTEAIEIIYDPKVVTYAELVKEFWRNIDPTTEDQQFADVGSQYRTGIFYHNEEQKKIAEASRAELAASGKYEDPIVTEITPASQFWPAEEYHQKYYKKATTHYNMYSVGSGRKGYIEKMWGKDRK